MTLWTGNEALVVFLSKTFLANAVPAIDEKAWTVLFFIVRRSTLKTFHFKSDLESDKTY